MLSSDESLAAIVETTAVQSLQLSATARASRAEEKRKTFNVEGIMMMLSCLVLKREWIPSS